MYIWRSVWLISAGNFVLHVTSCREFHITCHLLQGISYHMSPPAGNFTSHVTSCKEFHITCHLLQAISYYVSTPAGNFLSHVTSCREFLITCHPCLELWEEERRQSIPCQLHGCLIQSIECWYWTWNFTQSIIIFAGCEWGDRASWCSKVWDSPKDCYSESTRTTCCDSCEKLKSDDPGQFRCKPL